MLFSSWLYLQLAACVTLCVFLVNVPWKKTLCFSLCTFGSSRQIYSPVITIEIIWEMLVYRDNFFWVFQGFLLVKGAVFEVFAFLQSLTQRDSDSWLQLLHHVISETAGM